MNNDTECKHEAGLVSSRHRPRSLLAVCAVLVLTACGGQDDKAASASVLQLPSSPVSSAKLPAAVAPAVPGPATAAVPSMPALLTEEGQQPLIAAIASTYPVIEQMSTKAETGEVRAIRTAQAAARMDQARDDLASIKRNLATLSANGLPTYALIHNVSGDGNLRAWIVLPDGGVVAGATTTPYAGLGSLQAGLGVDRIAATRGPQLKGAEAPRLDAEVDVDVGDQVEMDDELERGPGKRNSPASIKQRRETLEQAAATLLPGDVRRVLAAGEGRLLVVPVRDTGTAPYAALPLGGADDFAARRWSFVVMQDVKVLADSSSWFDIGQVDLAKSIVVGDPEDMRDVKYSFPALPGARKEALAVASDLGIDERNVLIGPSATRNNVVRAIERSEGQGVIYMATHAVADPGNPLTRGFVVLSKNNLFAGELRTTSFKGWDQHQPLVVMSACQTALGRVFEGGTFGVARTWTNAGAGQVVASLWNVSDLATYRLMIRFVAGLKQGKAPEQALQAAQLETLRNYPNDPKMWASFTIIGKPSVDNRVAAQPADATR